MRRAEWQRGWGLAFDASVSDPDVFRVAYEVRYDDLATGHDRGLVVFVVGWLVVDGEQASFALRPCDVAVRADGSMTLVGGGWLRFRDDQRPAELESKLADWCREPSPAGEPIFPPTRVHPASLTRALVPGIPGVPLLGAAWFAFGTSAWGNILGLALAGAGLAFVCTAWSTGMILRKRDRFAQREIPESVVGRARVPRVKG